MIELAPEDRNTALGGLTFAGLLVAVVAQPIVGALSDRTRSRFGPRLPWMALGCAMCAVAGALTVIAPVFWTLLVAYMLVQLSTNTTQGPWQAVVPHEVPRESHGRAAAIKSVLEMASAVAGRAAGERRGLDADVFELFGLGGWLRADVLELLGLGGWLGADVFELFGLGGWLGADVFELLGLGGWLGADVLALPVDGPASHLLPRSAGSPRGLDRL